MKEAVREKIYKMLDTIQDEHALAQVMEDIAFYSSKEDVVENLSDKQQRELSAAIEEADKNEVISWADFKNEINEWKKKS